MASHTATGEWQSFEVRMRRRRAERLLVRAEVALDEGFLDEARLAVAEAKRLSSSFPGIEDIEARILAVEASAHAEDGGRRRLVTPTALVFVALLVVVVGLLVSTQLERATAPAQPVPTAAAESSGEPAPSSSPASVIVQTKEEPPVVTARTAEPRQPSSAPSPSAPSASVRPPDAPAAGGDAPPAASDTEAGATASPLRVDTPAADVRAPVLPPAAAPPVPEPAPAQPVASEPAPAPAPAPSDEDLVRAALDRYAAAYSHLDAAAAQAVWPRVNRDALARAFGDLAAQSITLGNCAVDVQAAVARATCSGTATWQPKVGAGGPRTDPRRWSFDLNKGPNGWLIRNARVQNR